MKNKKLPIGVESFSKMIEENYYYVDKTGFIKDLLDLSAEVTLFTRPRRFGKSLNLDMIKSFFKIGADEAFFEGLKISKEKELCEKYLGRYPVISISLKNAEGSTYENAIMRMSWALRKEIRQYQYLLQSDKLTYIDKQDLKPFFNENLSAALQEEGLYLLSEMLYKHHGKKVIILIDEYDVPLDKAYINGYYQDMLEHLRVMFGETLKTNNYIQFAVITGCLRIARESIFTGINNFKVRTISDTDFSEYFGFTDNEVRKMLKYYDIEEKFGLFKEWYDGYRFGDTDIYCPWDVLNQCYSFIISKDAEMESHWKNSSGNYIVRDIIEKATATTKSQIERLISGEGIEKEVVPELTYTDLENGYNEVRQNYLWSVLFASGYLTDAEKPDRGIHKLVIPNLEVREIYETQILLWFQEKISKNSKKFPEFCNAIEEGDVRKIEMLFNEFMSTSISIRDTCSRKAMKENFYHGMLLGLLKANDNWVVQSNHEAGNGYADIILKNEQKKTGCIFEVKYAENGKFDIACKNAVQQIKDKCYTNELEQDGIRIIYQYGVACYRKDCQVICEKIE